MGLDQLTAFRALCYRNCSLRPRGQRKGWHKRTSNNVGDRKAPLGSGWFFIIPQQLMQLHFPAVREPFLSSLTSSVPQWTEASLSWLQPLLVSQAVCPTMRAIWRLSAEDGCPRAVLQLEEEDWQLAPFLCTPEDRCCSCLFCQGKSPIIHLESAQMQLLSSRPSETTRFPSLLAGMAALLGLSCL